MIKQEEMIEEVWAREEENPLIQPQAKHWTYKLDNITAYKRGAWLEDEKITRKDGPIGMFPNAETAKMPKLIKEIEIKDMMKMLGREECEGDDVKIEEVMQELEQMMHAFSQLSLVQFGNT